MAIHKNKIFEQEELCVFRTCPFVVRGSGSGSSSGSSGRIASVAQSHPTSPSINDATRAPKTRGWGVPVEHPTPGMGSHGPVPAFARSQTWNPAVPRPGRGRWNGPLIEGCRGPLQPFLDRLIRPAAPGRCGIALV